jgi:hypothetical protein
VKRFTWLRRALPLKVEDKLYAPTPLYNQEGHNILKYPSIRSIRGRLSTHPQTPLSIAMTHISSQPKYRPRYRIAVDPHQPCGCCRSHGQESTP